MKILLRGPLLTNSGYGVHARQIFEVLEKQPGVELFCQCTGWGACHWLIDPDDLGGLVGKIMSKSVPIEQKNFDMSVQVQLPDEWDASIANVNIGVTAAVETTKCNPAWIEKCNLMDKVIVPSTFTKNVLKRSGIVYKQIYVIPEWFNQSIIDKSSCDKIHYNDERYQFDTKFNFLVMGLITGLNPERDRKNMLMTIKWLLEEFSEEDVGIVLKTSFGKSSLSDKKVTADYIKNVAREARTGANPKIHLIHGNMTKEEIAALYHCPSIKAYVSATRGEGYGLPIIDAAAAGIPIAVTGWSGHFEYLDKELIHEIDYSIVDIPKEKVDGRIFVKNTRWANPLEHSFKESVRNIYENHKQSKENAKALKKKILSNYNKAEITKMYQKVLFE